MHRLLKRASFFAVAIGLLSCFALTGCGTKEDKPKGENGGTYYEGPIKGQRTKDAK